MKLDVHILKMDYTPEDVFKQCLDSVIVAANNAGYRVAIHVVDGIYGHLGKSRELGYSKGTAEYVTHVDDDDWVEPHAFRAMAKLLHSGVRAVTTGENIVSGSRIAPAPYSRHHLAVFKRSELDKVSYGSFRFYPDQYLLSRVDAVHLNQCLYNHRVYEDSGSRRARSENAAEAAREYALVKDPSLMIIENSSPAAIAAAIDRELDE